MNFKLVLADSFYGESESNFIKVLEELELSFVVTIRSNHVVWLQPGERARWNKWRKFDRVFSDGRTEVRWIQEIIFGRRGSTDVLDNYNKNQLLCHQIRLGTL